MTRGYDETPVEELRTVASSDVSVEELAAGLRHVRGLYRSQANTPYVRGALAAVADVQRALRIHPNEMLFEDEGGRR